MSTVYGCPFEGEARVRALAESEARKAQRTLTSYLSDQLLETQCKLTETAAERDALLSECQRVTAECSQAIIERDQAREQVKALLEQRDELAAKLSLVTVALKNLDLAHNHQTLCRAKEEARAAIASVESEGE